MEKKKLTFIQSIRRLQQSFKKSGGFHSAFNTQDSHLVILKKLYEKHGLTLHRTSLACPEQYDVLKDGKQVAYYRLRHGFFTVDFTNYEEYENCSNEEEIYTAMPKGDGMFKDDERFKYMSEALKAVLKKLDHE